MKIVGKPERRSRDLLSTRQREYLYSGVDLGDRTYMLGIDSKQGFSVRLRGNANLLSELVASAGGAPGIGMGAPGEITDRKNWNNRVVCYVVENSLL